MEEVPVRSHGSEPIKNKIHQLKLIDVQSKSMTKLRNNFEVLKNILSVADLLNSLELKDMIRLSNQNIPCLNVNRRMMF